MVKLSLLLVNLWAGRTSCVCFLHSSRMTKPWEYGHLIDELWVYSARLKVPSGYELDENIMPSTNSTTGNTPSVYTMDHAFHAEDIFLCYRCSNYWQHAKCLHHGPCIYAEYIFTAIGLQTIGNSPKCLLDPFIPVFFLTMHKRLTLNSNFIKLYKIENLSASSFFYFIFSSNIVRR